MFLLVGVTAAQTLPSLLPFIMLTLLSETENGDSSNTRCTCERRKKKAKQREKFKKQQRSGFYAISCNGTSSAGAHTSKGLIPSGA